jgi:iron complex outermembrane recepter protein
MNNNKRRFMLPALVVNATLVALAGAVGSDAQAQQASEPAASSDTQLEQVVVTATKRGNEDLQTVPIAITAESQATLEAKGAVDFSDYARSVPSLSFVDSGPAFKTYVIRGVRCPRLWR